VVHLPTNFETQKSVWLGIQKKDIRFSLIPKDPKATGRQAVINS